MHEPVDAAVTYEKLISKICFARFGDTLPHREDELLAEMYHHLRALETKPVTRQAIKNWVKNGAVPRRDSALIFLNSYMDFHDRFSTSEAVTTISSEVAKQQRQVWFQVSDFLKRHVVRDLEAGVMPWRPPGALPHKNRINIYSPEDGRILIDHASPPSDQLGNIESLIGTYHCYRTRFRFVSPYYITREVVQIFRSGKHLRFKHWYLHEGEHLEKFEGIVSIIGYSVWMIGGNSRDADRLRVMKFRYIPAKISRSDNVLWGLMLTDLPNISAPEPVACRILMIKKTMKREARNISTSIRSEVANLKQDDLDYRLADFIIRAIDNHTTANSVPNSVEPVMTRRGLPATDGTLRVDQQTIENMSHHFRVRDTDGPVVVGEQRVNNIGDNDVTAFRFPNQNSDNLNRSSGQS